MTSTKRELHFRQTASILANAKNKGWEAFKFQAILQSGTFKNYPMPSSIKDVTVNCSTDMIAESIKPSQYKDHSALHTTGNGDCFYNAVSLLLFGDETYALEIRVRTVVELTVHEPFYIQSDNLKKVLISDQTGSDTEMSDHIDLFNYIVQTSAETLKLSTRASFRTEVMESIRQYRDSSILHFVRCASAIKCNIKSIRPELFANIGTNEMIHGGTFCPRPSLIAASSISTLMVMWTCCRSALLCEKKSNHFVPLYSPSHSSGDNQTKTSSTYDPKENSPKSSNNEENNNKFNFKFDKEEQVPKPSTDKAETPSASYSAEQQTSDAPKSANMPQSRTYDNLNKGESDEEHHKRKPDTKFDFPSKRPKHFDTESVNYLDPADIIIKTDNDRYQFLTCRQISENFKYPPNSQGRRYSFKWQQQFTWLRFSKKNQAAFCAFCTAFQDTCGGTSGGHCLEFIKNGFSDWKNAMGEKRGVFHIHATSERHKNCELKASNFLQVAENKMKSMNVQINEAYNESINTNKLILLSILDVIIMLGRKCLGFRGNYDASSKQEDGNFQYFINWKSNFDTVLANHISTCKGNAKYMSPKIQNELIDLCGQEIRQNIIRQCLNSKFWSVIADECQDVSTISQLSICLRYLVKQDRVFVPVEEFVGFIELEKTNAQTIATVMEQHINNWGLDFSKLRGQGYDGCATMSGEVSGVQKRIKNLAPRSRFYHCRSHKLNLVVVTSCKSVPAVRNFMDMLVKLSWFLSASSKRKNILKGILKEGGNHNVSLNFDLLYDAEQYMFAANRHTMPSLCETRWTARVDTLSFLVKHYHVVIAALERIGEESTGSGCSDANMYRLALENFDYIFCAVVVQFVLGYLRPLSVSLQAVKCDLLKAHTNARTITNTLASTRESEETYLQLYNRAKVIAEMIGVTPSVKRKTNRQQHRANAPSTSTEQHFKINIFLPFMDHVLQHLNDRFPDDLSAVLYAYYLIPAHLGELDNDGIDQIHEEYQEDLPFPMSFHQEIQLWRQNFLLEPNPPDTLETTLKFADEDFFPNIATIFQLLLTLPVGSCSSERSFSAMRRLKTWNRATMGEERLSGLALMHVHKDKELNMENILRRFDQTGSRCIGHIFN